MGYHASVAGRSCFERVRYAHLSSSSLDLSLILLYSASNDRLLRREPSVKLPHYLPEVLLSLEVDASLRDGYQLSTSTNSAVFRQGNLHDKRTTAQPHSRNYLARLLSSFSMKPLIAPNRSLTRYSIFVALSQSPFQLTLHTFSQCNFSFLASTQHLYDYACPPSHVASLSLPQLHESEMRLYPLPSLTTTGKALSELAHHHGAFINNSRCLRYSWQYRDTYGHNLHFRTSSSRCTG